jgi:hypothetical protein
VADAAAPPYRIVALRAYLYFNDTGRFSPAIPPGASLWNTIVGEGWAKHPSDATLVEVTIAGAAGSFEPGRSVRIVVRAGAATALLRTIPVPIVARSGRTRVAVLVPGTGCKPLQVRATVVGQAEASTRALTVPFACGE